MPRHLVLPRSAFDDVKSVIRLEEAQLRRLDDLFGSSASIAPQRPEFIRQVGEHLQLDTATAESVVLVCQFLLTVVEEGSPPREILNDVREFLGRTAPPEERDVVTALDAKRAALESLLTPKPERSKALKIAYLTHGIHPTVDSFRTVCELRPVFECPEGREQIVGFVPTVLLEVKLSDLQGRPRTVLIQLTPDKLAALKDVIGRSEEKLDAIRAKLGRELLEESQRD